MAKNSKSVCDIVKKALPFLINDKDVLKEMMNDTASERIITSRVLPILKDEEGYKQHIRDCVTCSDNYNAEVDRRIAKSDEPISVYDMDQAILKLWS